MKKINEDDGLQTLMDLYEEENIDTTARYTKTSDDEPRSFVDIYNDEEKVKKSKLKPVKRMKKPFWNLQYYGVAILTGLAIVFLLIFIDAIFINDAYLDSTFYLIFIGIFTGYAIITYFLVKSGNKRRKQEIEVWERSLGDAKEFVYQMHLIDKAIDDKIEHEHREYERITQEYKENLPKVQCPYCKSMDTVKISMMSTMASTAMWGLNSKKIGKQWHCNNCKSNF